MHIEHLAVGEEPLVKRLRELPLGPKKTDSDDLFAGQRRTYSRLISLPEAPTDLSSMEPIQEAMRVQAFLSEKEKRK